MTHQNNQPQDHRLSDEELQTINGGRKTNKATRRGGRVITGPIVIVSPEPPRNKLPEEAQPSNFPSMPGGSSDVRLPF